MILLVASITMLIALAFLFGIAPRFIKSLSMMSDEEKARLSLKRLYCNVGIVIMSLSIILFIAGCNPSLSNQFLRISIFLWVGVCILDVILIEKSKFFVKK